MNLEALQNQLSQLDSLHALRTLFAAWSYDADFSPVFLKSATKADEAAQENLAGDIEIIARAGAFQIIYAPLKDWNRAIGSERLVISRLLDDYPFALWIFSDKAKTHWHFVNVKRGAGSGKSAMGRHVLRRYSFARGESPGRTSVEQLQKIDLAELATLPGIAPAALEVQARHDAAFDVEAVTRDFFRDYKSVFENVESKVQIGDENARRLWTQRLCNRLMFLRFLEKKSWLEFEGDKNYLRALFKAAQNNNENFLEDRLYFTFFWGLNFPGDNAALEYSEAELRPIRGQVPFLNGGLFDLDDAHDIRGAVKLENVAFAGIFELFDRYNFTIHESTPFDLEIGIDPEMLGKVFEELVTGRHESGSYYTPRGIVSFMARESLKGYLEKGEAPEVVAQFVDGGDATMLTDAEGVLGALRNVTVCDPACGSGAYLLGMMQELLRLREALFAAKAKDHASIYKRKLEIIETNLYGVDKDPFAVNIAMLRLWLSLIIEYAGSTPPPLPNLKYKIGCGDSLSAPLAGAAQLVMHENALHEFVNKKGEYLRANGPDKKPLESEIEVLRNDIRLWTHQGEEIKGFDWVVEFAEVFAPSQNFVGARHASPDSGSIGVLGEASLAPTFGGFDIVIANPPYVRQELIKEQKPQLKKIFGALYSGTADLYVFFYLRAHELLRNGGVIAFISPNKWFRAAYGGKLRKHFAEYSAVRSITDFGDLPVFQAATAYPMVFIAQKYGVGASAPSSENGDNGAHASTPYFAQIKSLDAPYPDVRALMDEYSAPLPQGAIQGENWNLSDAATSARLASMRKAGTPLGEYVKGQIYRGVLTGFNEAFVIDGATRAKLIAQDERSSELIKPLAVGRDIRKWSVDYKDKFLIVTKIGVPIKDYPAIFKHLKQWQPQLEARQDQGKHWWELRACAYYAEFEKPKIICPDIAPECRFSFDRKNTFVPNTAYVFPVEDLYLLGVLNSQTVNNFYAGLSSAVRGGYLRFIRQYLEKIPIPTPAPSDRLAIEILVAACLEKRGANCAGEESEINARVLKLFGLNCSTESKL